MFSSVQQFLRSFDFYKSLVLLLGILVPMAVGYALGQTSMAVGVVMGVFLSAPSDVAGGVRNRTIGLSLATLVAIVSTLLINIAQPHPWLIVPVLAMVVFSSAMLAVYGFRASLVSFSGLLAIVLAFAHPISGFAALEHAGLMLLGGGWYLLLSTTAYRLTAKTYNARRLAHCMELTADCLRTKGEIVKEDDDESALRKQLLEQHRLLTEQHEELREIFINERSQSGASRSADRQLLVFIELVDILELTMAQAAGVRQELPAPQEDTYTASNLSALFFALAERLQELAGAVARGEEPAESPKLEFLFNEKETELQRIAQLQVDNEKVIAWKNGFDYAKKQWHKVQTIERIASNIAEREKLTVDRSVAKRFLSRQDYDIKLIGQHFSESSPIFRHALRLTLTVLVAYTIGQLIPVQNAYWLMLTVIVIMRPSYGLTKDRSLQRVYGTLIGAVVALGIVLLTQNVVVYGVLAVISLVLAFSLIQRNYRTSAVFITLNIVFLYALMQPDAFTVIQYRVIDTAIGAALAFIAGRLFWPSWEAQGIKSHFLDVLQANQQYLKEIAGYYQNKGQLPIEYKLARKAAFLAHGNLSAAFQRVTQDPKSKQKSSVDIYEWVVLSHTFLNAAAALGTFVQHHETTTASPHFSQYIKEIDGRLRSCRLIIEGKEVEPNWDKGSLQAADQYLAEKLENITQATESTLAATSAKVFSALQEAELVIEQLRWLLAIADNLLEVNPQVEA
jgi:uncharacterized membrane protein YccC